MRKVRVFLLVTAISAVMAMVVGEATAGKKTVKLGDDFFSPAKLSVAKGTLVRFKWIGNNDHNVVKKSGPGGSFASTTTSDPGVNFKKKFKKAGKYKLICTIHAPDMKMTLNVG